MPKPRITRRRILLAILIVLLALIARPAVFLLHTYYTDPKPVDALRPYYTNDASGLNETAVAKWPRPSKDSAEAIIQITELVKQAARENLKISIAGARHSMGGHTIYPGGMAIDMNGVNYLHFDEERNILLAGAGAHWSDIIPYLDKHGKSVAVMQSNNSFSVGGSISVNCHGWQPDSPPIASSVESFRLIDAKGDIITCSRTQNAELFSLVLGGYGLFGVVLDVELRVVDNKVYKTEQHVIKSSEYISKFIELVKNDPSVGMAYGRISISPANFMDEAILSIYKTDSSSVPRPVTKNGLAGLRRTVFRGSADSDYGKKLRWRLEKWSASIIDGKKFSRNQLLNEGVEVYQNTDTNYTDILHEYFIPIVSVGKFIDSLKSVIPQYKVDLLNITVRNVMKDDDAFLAYAHEEVFGFVMLYYQRKDSSAEKEMQRVTQRLIDVAVSLNGTYYLPYRLHATKEQMHKAYPKAKEFFLLKLKYDSAELFQNRFYETYKLKQP